MAITAELTNAILEAWETSNRTLARKVAVLRKEHGPISGDEARGVIAAEAGIDLKKYGWTTQDAERIRQLRNSGVVSEYKSATPASAPPKGKVSTASSTAELALAPKPPTRRQIFDGRAFHGIVVARSRNSFVAGENQDAVLKAFRSVNNRVKNLSGSSADGKGLMGKAFSDDDPLLDLSDRSNASEQDEHAGTRFMMMGAVVAMRNPRAHEDHWIRDADDAYVLDALSYASLLHRLLDIAESRKNP